MTTRTRDNLGTAGKMLGIITASAVILGLAWVNLAEPRIDRKIQEYDNRRMTPIECQIEAIDTKLDAIMTDSQRVRADRLLQMKRRERGITFNP